MSSVDHPSHYKAGKYECIDVMEDTFGAEAVKSFCILNAFKYIYRADSKGGDEDIKKARWYLNRYCQIVDTEGSNK